MPSPVAHSFIGLTFGIAACLPLCDSLRAVGRQMWARRNELLFCLVLANAPDVDYFFGIPLGNLNFFHQTITHTLGWIALVAVSVWIFLWRARRGHSGWVLLFILALLGSHLIADFFTADTSPPCGIMLAWPFSERYFHSPFSIFMSAAKRSYGDLFTLRNLQVVAVEALVTLPLVAVALWLKCRARANGAPRLTANMLDAKRDVC